MILYSCVVCGCIVLAITLAPVFTVTQWEVGSLALIDQPTLFYTKHSLTKIFHFQSYLLIMMTSNWLWVTNNMLANAHKKTVQSWPHLYWSLHQFGSCLSNYTLTLQFQYFYHRGTFCLSNSLCWTMLQLVIVYSILNCYYKPIITKVF